VDSRRFPQCAATRLISVERLTTAARQDKSWMLPPARSIIESAAMLYFSYSKGFKAGGFNG